MTVNILRQPQETEMDNAREGVADRETGGVVESLIRWLTNMWTQIKSSLKTPQYQTNWALLNVILSSFMFLFVSALELIIITNLLNFVNTTFGKEESGSSSILGIYFGIFIAGMLFQFLGALDAYLETNTMQIVAVGAFNFLGVAYAIIQINQVNNFKSCASSFYRILTTTVANSNDQYQQVYDLQSSCYFESIVRKNGNLSVVNGGKSLISVANDINSNLDLFNLFPPYQYVILIIMLLGSLTGVYFAYKSYQQTGWHIFSIQGADIQKKKMMERYHIFLLFLKVNGFFFCVIGAQYIMETYFSEKNNNSRSVWTLIVSFIVVTIVFLVYYVLGYSAMKRSNYILAVFFLLILMINFLGSIIVLWRIYIQAPKEFQSSRIWLTVFISAQMVSNTVTYVFSVLLILDFKEGLLEVLKNMEKKKPGTTTEEEEETNVRRFTL